nr:hypothetical protein Datr000093 [Darna trima granulovirus]
MNKIQVDVSMFGDVSVEPIALKLAHNKDLQRETINATNAQSNEGQTTTATMWILVVSIVFIIVIVFVASYILVNRANDDTIYDEEEFGEL